MKNGKRIHKVEIQRLPDDQPDTSYLDQEGFETRKEEWERGMFCFVGVRAKAIVFIPVNSDGVNLQQTITSGGLWGIESDSAESYFKEVAKEELDSLRQQLHELGFSKRAISAAFREVQHAS